MAESKMYKIKFKYRDEHSKWEWRLQKCICSGVKECIEFYGLDRGDVEYEILEVIELK